MSGAAWPAARGFPGQPKPSYHLELLFNPYTDKMIVTSRNYVAPGIQQVLAEEEPKSFRLPASPRDDDTKEPKDKYTRPGRWSTDTFGRHATALNDWLSRNNPQVLPGWARVCGCTGGQIIPDAVLPQVKADLRKSFPQYDKFDRIRREFDPQGRFMSAWQEKLLT